MYQLSRLLHDYHRDLYNHLEEHEIGPSLYAAPWFLTVFASQFPLGFVARVFGKCVYVCLPQPASSCSVRNIDCRSTVSRLSFIPVSSTGAGIV